MRAPWTSASFLLYTGGIVIAVSAGALLAVLADDYSSAAFVGWTALVVLVLGALAFGARASERPLAAGLFAMSAVIALAVLVGAIEDWFGWLARTNAPFAGFHVSHFVIELTLIVGAVAARHVFRFPLLVLISTASTWFFVTDLLSNGGNWSAVVRLLFGLVAMAVGFDWILIAFASCTYVLIASSLGRSSYAVLAAIGLFLTTTHFVLKWFGPKDVGFFSASEPGRPWAAALSYTVYGLVLILIGLWLARRRPPAEPL